MNIHVTLFPARSRQRDDRVQVGEGASCVRHPQQPALLRQGPVPAQAGLHHLQGRSHHAAARGQQEPPFQHVLQPCRECGSHLNGEPSILHENL